MPSSVASPWTPSPCIWTFSPQVMLSPADFFRSTFSMMSESSVEPMNLPMNVRRIASAARSFDQTDTARGCPTPKVVCAMMAPFGG